MAVLLFAVAAGVLHRAADGPVAKNSLWARPAESVSRRFRDPGDGTILDRETGLRWQKCSYGQRYTGQICQGSALRMAWKDAMRACPRLAFEGTPGGWRLPELAELRTLLVDRGRKPMIDLDFFPSSYPFRYWSRGVVAEGGGTLAQAVNFLEGTDYGVLDASAETRSAEARDGKNYVRCVYAAGRDQAGVFTGLKPASISSAISSR